ncbi:probable G-protein coupled receptor 149 [Ambystoma mexicanum]|uniref:probable G-protein coupled receptor 149 n=1 Tax=Ambystoma mexicanum TaxID=8296 RepID=UPI0037E7447E
MSVAPSQWPTNGTNFFLGSQDVVDYPKGHKTFNVILFSLTLAITLVTLLGSVYSLVSLLRMRKKSTLSVIVASLSVDDLLSVLAATIFMLSQWSGQALPPPLCVTSALLYLFQAVSSNLKASVIVVYNFLISRRPGPDDTTERPVRMLWAVYIIWAASLLVSALPLCGWGGYAPTSWGCLADCTSSHALLLFALYSMCFCTVAVLSVPLTHQLLCSDEQQRRLFGSYQEISRGYLTPGTTLGSNDSFLSPEDPVDRTLRKLEGKCSSSETVFMKSPSGLEVPSSRSLAVLFAQKRFSLILALLKVILWVPLMIQMAVKHLAGLHSHSFETLSFLLALLAATVTPVFLLSERWIHLPCGCIINCRRDMYAVSTEESQTKRKGFEFNLSFQQGYGIYKISKENPAAEEKSLSCHNLMNHGCDLTKEPLHERSFLFNSAAMGFSTEQSPDSSLHNNTHKYRSAHSAECKPDVANALGWELPDKIGGINRDDARHFEKPAFFEGQERRLSHEEGHKPELSEWEWCRSKSERTSRQRSGGALAIPICAFQGTVSLHAPTGKTLSLSTYEVSREGQKISPSRKVEVYRSKSVGHEPNTEDSPDRFLDTNVKIHLEVLEICDNEEAMDTVSIISNISQSSTQARSPSLRYSRKENRFVSCDLGETASYSLFIPTNNHESDMNISIPDTVEAHRRNSKRQHQDRDGYQEEIQLLNKAYRKREQDDQTN